MEFLKEDPDFDHLRSDPGSANSSAVPAWRIDRVPESRGQFIGGSAMSPVASVVGPGGDRGSEMPNFRPKANLCGFRPDGRQPLPYRTNSRVARHPGLIYFKA